MYEMIKNRKLMTTVSDKLDEEISKYHNGYHYDFDSAYAAVLNDFTEFDVSAAVALRVVDASVWDGRYSQKSITWAKNFLYENDIDVEDYKNIRLCKTHSTILNGFAEWLSKSRKDEE